MRVVGGCGEGAGLPEHRSGRASRLWLLLRVGAGRIAGLGQELRRGVRRSDRLALGEGLQTRGRGGLALGGRGRRPGTRGLLGRSVAELRGVSIGTALAQLLAVL